MFLIKTHLEENNDINHQKPHKKMYDQVAHASCKRPLERETVITIKTSPPLKIHQMGLSKSQVFSWFFSPSFGPINGMFHPLSVYDKQYNLIFEEHSDKRRKRTLIISIHHSNIVKFLSIFPASSLHAVAAESVTAARLAVTGGILSNSWTFDDGRSIV